MESSTISRVSISYKMTLFTLQAEKKKKLIFNNISFKIKFLDQMFYGFKINSRYLK